MHEKPVKIIIDTNLWISFLIGHQTQLVRRMLADTIGADYIVSGDADLTDLGQYNQTSIIKLAGFKAMMLYI